MGQTRDDRPVAIVPCRDRKPGIFAGRRAAAFGGNEEVSRQFASIGQANRHAVFAARAFGHFTARVESDQRLVLRRLTAASEGPGRAPRTP